VCVRRTWTTAPFLVAKAVGAMPTISVPRDVLFEAMGQKFTEDEFQEVRALTPFHPSAPALGDSATLQNSAEKRRL
jgi:hypothetical protein